MYGTPEPPRQTIAGRVLFDLEHDATPSQPAYIDATGIHLIPVRPDETLAQVTWGPSRTVLFTREVSGHRHVFRMNLDGTGVTQLTSGDQVSQDAAVASPDGRFIAYGEIADPTGVDRGIRLAKADGMFVRVLTPLTTGSRAGQDSPSFSPDGQWVAYVRVTDVAKGLAGLWVVRTDGTHNHRLTDDSTQPDPPQWSPDGTSILFGAHQGGSFVAQKLWVVPVTGGAPRPLMPSAAADPGSMSAGSWSPDGHQIVFRYFRTGLGIELRLVNADGTHMRTLWHGLAEEPHWAS